MKKNILNSLYVGSLQGLSLMLIISLLISADSPDGSFQFLSEGLIYRFNSEISAVAFQIFSALFIGALFGLASYMLSYHKWREPKRIGVYLLFALILLIPVAYFFYWFEGDFYSITRLIVTYLVVFEFIWIIKYFRLKQDIDKINLKLQS